MKLSKDFKYAIKSIKSVFSGYSYLASKCIYDGTFEEIETGEPINENPYYVCAEFKNGRHIPLPLILEPLSDFKYSPIQSICLTALRLHPAMQKAIKECKSYEIQYEIAQNPIKIPYSPDEQEMNLAYEHMQDLGIKPRVLKVVN